MISFPVGARSLVDVLDLFDRDAVERSAWTFERVDCGGRPEDCDQVLRWSDEGATVTTADLRRIAAHVQFVEGSVIGLTERRDRWVTVRAVDGAWWDVEADDDIERRLLAIVPGAHAPPTG